MSTQVVEPSESALPETPRPTYHTTDNNSDYGDNNTDDTGARMKPPPLDMQQQISTDGSVPRTPGPGSATFSSRVGKKLGHRRVDQTGQVTYKKKPTSELMAAIQLGIGQSIGCLAAKPDRDVLMQDFTVVESVFFPGEGSNLTPAHHYSDFRFKTYAPIAFRYFRELFCIQPEDFMLSLCDEPMKELSNPGASGSIFYITADDEFIIKTVQHKEAEFLQKLLPGYYMNLNQNPRTLLPKFYGLYCYQCGGKNIRFVVMNNLLPSNIRMHEKYDLKGSTYKRKASKNERSKASPVLKDLDFVVNYNEGILMEKEKYDALIKTAQRDCRVLESFKIMDYSLLLGLHNLDIAARERIQSRNSVVSADPTLSPSDQQSPGYDTDDGQNIAMGLMRGKSLRTRLAQFSTAMESIQVSSDAAELEDEDTPTGGIPCRNNKGERLLLYAGLIDILQSYRFKKKLEHTMKAIVADGDTISVHRPSFYSLRFQAFFEHKVFKKIPTPLKHSPSKKRGVLMRGREISESQEAGQERRTIPERAQRMISFSDDAGAIGGRPDLLPEDSTPPPTFAEAVATSTVPSLATTVSNDVSTVSEVSYSKPQVSSSEQASHDAALRSVSASSLGTSPHFRRAPSPLSGSESTPTHTGFTEGTPSFTASSPSCSSDVLDTATNFNNDATIVQSPTHSASSHSPTKVSKVSSNGASYGSAREDPLSQGEVIRPDDKLSSKGENEVVLQVTYL